METQRICPSCQKPLPPDVPMGLCPECLIKSGFNTGTDPGNPGKESGFVPPPVKELQKLFPQLEILELIGKGGMGAVYQARQPALDRLVALKILPPGAADDAGFAERFNREARALARLNHPHIVAVHDFGQAGGQAYLVMEFVDGPNLRQVEQAGRLTPEQALAIVPQICEALQFAHNEGVVHRDIKPENILLDKKVRVKITDFGIAKIVGVPAGKVSLTGAQDVLGTPHYMAPEQVEKPATVDHRADIYSLGVVFYELLTGELPLGKFQPPSKKVQVDVRLDEVVLHALEKEPERRYQQASEVKTDVETIAATPSASSSGRESAPPEAARPPAAVVTSSNAKEATIVFAGTSVFLYLLAVVAEMPGATVPLRGFLIVNCVVGLLICALSLAGRWPFPSPWFPAPNFSSRNLRRHKTARDSTPRAAGRNPLRATIVSLLLLAAVALGGLFVATDYARRKSQTRARISAVNQRLAGEVRHHLEADGYAYRVVQVAVYSPGFPGGECTVIGLRRATEDTEVPGGLNVRHDGAGLWFFTGWGALNNLRFQVDAAHEMGLPQSLPHDAQNSVVRFGPVIERTLNDLDELRGGEALDLDSGRSVDLPKGIEERPENEQMQWLKIRGADVLLDHVGGRWGLLTPTDNELQLVALSNQAWDSVTGRALLQALAAEPSGLEIKQRWIWTIYVLATNAQPPLTFAFRTGSGAHGVLQITRFEEQPNTARLRYRLAEDSQRKFVRLVVDTTAMTFEGQPTSWEGAGALLAKVPDRNKTVLEFAVTSDQITVAQQNEWFQKATALARQHGFEYTSFIGIHPLGSKGTTRSSARSVPPRAKAKPGGTRGRDGAQWRGRLPGCRRPEPPREAPG